jgi:hypothetical protein
VIYRIISKAAKLKKVKRMASEIHKKLLVVLAVAGVIGSSSPA